MSYIATISFTKSKLIWKVSQAQICEPSKKSGPRLGKIVERDKSELLKSCLAPNVNDALQGVTGERSQIMDSRTSFKTVQYCVVCKGMQSLFFLLRCANHVCGVLPGHGWSWGVYVERLSEQRTPDVLNSIAWEVSSVVCPTQCCTLHLQGQPRTLFFNLDRSSTARLRAHAQSTARRKNRSAKYCSNSALLYQRLLRLIMIKVSHVCEMADILMFRKGQYSEY